MTLQVIDRIKETTATTGTGTWTLAGAVTGFQAFSTVGDTNTVYYAATDGSSAWEVGLGTYSSGANTLARTTVLKSSNSNLAVNFTTGPTIWGDYPADRAVLTDNVVTMTNKTLTAPVMTAPVLGTPASGNLSNCSAYPVASLTGLGTGVATALAVNVGSAGAFVTFNGALGTPSSGTLTNATGLPITAGTTGTLGLSRGGTNADLSATGGASQVLKQVSSGAAITVGQLANTDISGLGTAATQNTGTSGATLPFLNGANTWSGVQSFNSGDVALKGATSGTITLNAAATAGSNTITLPAGTTDFSATGGTSQVVKQTSAGGAFTVAQLAASDITGLATGANPSASVGLAAVNGSSANFLRADGAPPLSQSIAPTWTGLHTHSAGLAFGNETVAFGTTGAGIQGAWTHTDSTTGAGTVATNYEHLFGAVTSTTPTNAITITNEYGAYFALPVAGTHLTFTNNFSAGYAGPIRLDFDGSQNNQAIQFNGLHGFYHLAGDNIVYSSSNANLLEFGVQILRTTANGFIGWSSTNDATGNYDTAIYRNGAGIVEVNSGANGTFRDLKLRNLLASGGNGSYVQTPSMTVANLPAAATAGAGARCFVTDATATTFLSTVAGSGANKVPVVSDGTNWLIG